MRKIHPPTAPEAACFINEGLVEALSRTTFVLDFSKLLSSIKSSLLSSSYILGFAGQTTAMSRRRVSCRELGKPDCDGWLWKKRKESSVFIAQKWQRFWFVLKGPALYWYSSQQVGLSGSLMPPI